MSKTILITGSTDGIGLATACSLLEQGHHVLLHGRNAQKLSKVCRSLVARFGKDKVGQYCADLSVMTQVSALAQAVAEECPQLDVLINNAGVFHVDDTVTSEGFDMRFMVNTIAPYILMQGLRSTLGACGRVINLSSAAQSPFEAQELLTPSHLTAGAVYAKSKLALTMWSMQIGAQWKEPGPSVIAVNPKSFLGSKMVQEAYGMQGSSVQLGADILLEAALSERFAQASGCYFDNDVGQFRDPHVSASTPGLMAQLMEVLIQLEAQLQSS
ncbi:SDR family NAD(P)-dependent oxidoreductase [Pseudoalteromonas sp. Of7M-16]|uniref:SDR family NAD(P)-dependent oxidoreductase n=1 Tax=Pseudoalteromonas sp. Of7M-16 TaxID=2917756 RepID=UPI001EF60935|nr:SDR family NAD(P)-dependent oxidoreductase [Pseudoalteromonas sp. Of7M-16]MCG7548748.1 SDR family NAD(P)-dependent oxidoreductase [Pseudoalteromonas sp. Of7M-16]